MSDEVKILKAEIKRLRKTISSLTPSLDIMLKVRGYRVCRKGPSGDLILPLKNYSGRFYEKLRTYSFRLFLRDVIRHQDLFTPDTVSRYASRDVTVRYIDFLIRSGIARREGDGYCMVKRPVKSFGETLEWFVSTLLAREFQAETVWGARFRRPGVGGDYDLIAKIGVILLYMEIKSSPPKQIYDREIKAFMDRTLDLSPDIAVFFTDTELRMKDKIVPMFEAELQRRYGRPAPLERIERELFHINRKIYIINAKESIEANIGTVLQHFSRKDPEGLKAAAGDHTSP